MAQIRTHRATDHSGQPVRLADSGNIRRDGQLHVPYNRKLEDKNAGFTITSGLIFILGKTKISKIDELPGTDITLRVSNHFTACICNNEGGTGTNTILLR